MTPRTMRRVYLREAAVMLVLARLAVRFVPPARIFAWADRPPRRIRRFAADEIAWVSWAVENLGAKPWMNALCLPRALAAHAMLRRRGIASRLCLGVARDRGCAQRPCLGRDRRRQNRRRRRGRRIYAPRHVWRSVAVSAIAGLLRFDGGTVTRHGLERAANALRQYGPDRADIASRGWHRSRPRADAHDAGGPVRSPAVARRERGADHRRRAARQSRRGARADRRHAGGGAGVAGFARAARRLGKTRRRALADIARAVRGRDLGFCAAAL